MKEGDSADCFYVIVSGSARLVQSQAGRNLTSSIIVEAISAESNNCLNVPDQSNNNDNLKNDPDNQFSLLLKSGDCFGEVCS